jgi:drug/metabolite transporter (DMT)-like permease
VEPALYGLVVLIWGGTWLAIKYQVDGGPLTASICYRMAGAALVMFLIVLARRGRLRFSRREHMLMAGVGLCMFSANYIFLYWSEKYISSGLVALIFALTLPLNVVNSAIFNRTPIDRSILPTCILGITGCVTVFWNSVADFTWSSNSLRGVILALLATCCFSLGNVISDAAQNRSVPVLQMETYGLVYGTAIMIPITLVSGGFGFSTTPRYIGSLAYLIILGSVVAFGAYMWIIGRIGAGRAGYVTVLFPIVALLLSTFLEHYVWTPRALAGAALILAGSAIAVARGRKIRAIPVETIPIKHPSRPTDRSPIPGEGTEEPRDVRAGTTTT